MPDGNRRNEIRPHIMNKTGRASLLGAEGVNTDQRGDQAAQQREL
jgi:hypothetical protein